LKGKLRERALAVSFDFDVNQVLLLVTGGPQTACAIAAVTKNPEDPFHDPFFISSENFSVIKHRMSPPSYGYWIYQVGPAATHFPEDRCVHAKDRDLDD
jgi:hypothetical protein